MSESRTVTSLQAKKSLLKAFQVKRPLFLWGPPGIGKSELVEGITNDLNGLMIDLRLGQMEPTDIRGIPFYNKDIGKMDWAPPVELPDEETAAQYPIVVLFLDELNSAAPSVQSAAYQLILNRRIGKYRLPDNVVMVAAGNRESDKGVTYRMPTPLANRFIHQEMKVDFPSWLEWAVNNRVHKDVVGYLSFAKQDLYDFDAKSASRAFATPRSWTFVSQLLDDASDDDTTMNLIAGTVGEGLAVKFMAHKKVAGKMPNPADILSGKVKDLQVKEVSAMYSLVISMCYELQGCYREQGRRQEVPRDGR
jgi:MoxR-like ATPase